MRANFKLQRLFIDQKMAAGRTISLSKDQVNYLANVLRMAAGEVVLVFNGRDGEWKARLDFPAKKKIDLVLEAQTRPQPPPSELKYCFAPLKTGRLDYMVQKAVEMGAGQMQPVLTQHTQMHRVNLDRLRANIVEAAEQCGILSIPELSEPVKFNDLIDGWDQNYQLIFCDEGNASNNPNDILAKLDDRKLALLIGPEGGFSEEERKCLHASAFVTAIPLGPRILRADTAAVAAMAIVQTLKGDWR